MSDTKIAFRFFSVFEWEDEQEYLRQQHREGWRFVKLNLLGLYHFERCQPEDVVYQLDYNAEGSAHQAEYVRLFEDCGWEYLQSYVGYSYFRKPLAQMQGNEEGIFCDEDSRMEMLKRVFKGRVLPLAIILFTVVLPQLALNLKRVTTFQQVMSSVYTVLLVACVCALSSGTYQFARYKKRLTRGKKR